MSAGSIKQLRRAGAAALVLALCCLFFLLPVSAQADELEELDAQVSQLSAEYEKATAKVAELEDQKAATEKRIAQLEEVLAQRQDECSRAMQNLYMNMSNPSDALFAILNAGSLKETLRFIDDYSWILEHDYAILDEVSTLSAELQENRNQLTAQLREADAAVVEASNALEAAEKARDEVMERMAAEAAAAAAAGNQASSSGGSSAGSSSISSVDWSQDKTSFVRDWGARIDAYLSGSPLYGQGETFAAAAYDYNVDPRWSPAISCIESSKGAACFKPHNAWGWGSCSWSTWEEAIYAHVYGLARGYGYTISMEAAYKYCPPNAQHWYNRTLEEMNKI